MREFDLVSESAPLADDLQATGIVHLVDALDGDRILDLVDWLVYRDATSHQTQQVNEIARILENGSSSSRVGRRRGFAELEDRVPAGVQAAADAAMSVPGDAGSLLSDAWWALYSREPSWGDAYRDAIRAVEAAAIPVVSARDRTATLGKVISQMRTDGDWSVALEREHPQNPADKVLIDMMQALWSGHSDRHAGTSDFSRTTKEAATAAVGLAVTLVQWFASGVVVQRPKIP